MANQKPEVKAEEEVVRAAVVPKAPEVRGEVVKHDGTFLDVRAEGEIRRVKDKVLAKDYKPGQTIYLDAEKWQKAPHAPYAKPRKKD